MTPSASRSRSYSLSVLAAAALLQIATPFAVSGQDRAVLTARATVVEAESAWTAHRLAEEASRRLHLVRTEGGSPATRSAPGGSGAADVAASPATVAEWEALLPVRSDGPVLVWIARFEDGTYEVTVAHTGS